jgi:hypothetical protein
MTRCRYQLLLTAVSLLGLIVFVGSSGAGKAVPFSARGGLDIAHDAATTWAPDARLVYVENDEGVADGGTSGRWGYLFYSASRGKARGYSIRNGKIIEAADLGFDFEAPPLPDEWIDSEQAFAAAERKAGARYRKEHGGKLATMLLIRGAFNDDEPDATTWTLLYKAVEAPGLFVVIDAATGKAIRTWRG